VTYTQGIQVICPKEAVTLEVLPKLMEYVLEWGKRKICFNVLIYSLIVV